MGWLRKDQGEPRAPPRRAPAWCGGDAGDTRGKTGLQCPLQKPLSFAFFHSLIGVRARLFPFGDEVAVANDWVVCQSRMNYQENVDRAGDQRSFLVCIRVRRCYDVFCPKCFVNSSLG